MGIKNLMVLLKKNCPNSIKQLKIDHYTNKIIACDASIVNKIFITIGNISIYNLLSTN